MLKKLSIIQWFACVYAVMFFGIVALNYIPSIHDANGFMFGLFKLDPIDDALHLATAIWAGIAACISFRQSSLYFKIFGVFYFSDGILCMIFGQCLADFTLFTHSHDIAILNASNFMERLPLNIPHIIIGALAIFIGFWLSKRIQNKTL